MESENTNFSMPVMPAYGGYGNGGGFGFGNGDLSWLVLLLLICGGGWGMGGFGGGMWPMMMGAGMGGFGMDYLYPWLNNSQNINGGFRDQMLNTSIASIGDKITSGFGDVQTALCGGFAGVNAGIANGFAQAEIANNARQIADMQQAFAAQMATSQGFNGVQAALADVKFTEATEACATRTANATNTRDIIDNQTRVGQSILDKLCQLELDGYKRENDQLRSQLQFANMQASQVAQTAELRTSQATVANQLVSELRSCPIPSQPVYGNTPIFSCGGNNSYGCGCNGGFAN